jgi:hypothetical protein
MDASNQVAFEVGDMKAFFGRRTAGASLHGADKMEMASVLMGKAVHWCVAATFPHSCCFGSQGQVSIFGHAR